MTSPITQAERHLLAEATHRILRRALWLRGCDPLERLASAFRQVTEDCSPERAEALWDVLQRIGIDQLPIRDRLHVMLKRAEEFPATESTLLEPWRTATVERSNALGGVH